MTFSSHLPCSHILGDELERVEHGGVAGAEAEDEREARGVVGLLDLDDAVLGRLEGAARRALELDTDQDDEAALLRGSRRHVDPAVAAGDAHLQGYISE
jgi:hypothetical protein